eukprot:COSAG01_NODE_52170_length_348_cov_1.578313_1_plen_40_part_10
MALSAPCTLRRLGAVLQLFNIIISTLKYYYIMEDANSYPN